LAANFRWAFAGNVVYAACQWAMLSVLARLGTAEAVGQFVLGLSIAAPIMALTMLQLRSVQVTDVHEAFTFADYFGTRIVWTIAGLIAIVVCASVGGEDRGTFWVVVLVGMMKGVDSMSDIVRGLFQHRERMDLSGISLMVKGPPSLLALAVVMALTGSVVLASAATAVVWAVSFATYDLFYANRLLASGVAVPKSGKQIRPLDQKGVDLPVRQSGIDLIPVCAIVGRTKYPSACSCKEVTKM
jgi:O-antigen/teichoic acid export membrane protein